MRTRQESVADRHGGFLTRACSTWAGVHRTLRAADPNHMNTRVRFISQLVPRAAIKAARKCAD